ncbi:MAG TPA: D-glycerate dehydrogenase [Thermodesulfobacteriota bacterium]|nr:D-glycerate dehydrogenase [Thermodesulfobacteriota bacterium]
MEKIYVSAHYPGEPFERLRENYHVEEFLGTRLPTSDELLEGARGSIAVISTVSDGIDKEFIDLLPGLRIVSNCGVGYENIDVPYATLRGVMVTNTPDVLTETTADLAWALLISAARRVVEADDYVRRGDFKCWHPSLLLGQNIHGKTLGIFGMGRIGTAAARRASGFGMRVIYNNRKRNERAEIETKAVYVDFPELLKESDFIIVASPLNKGTRGRFGMNEFRQMKRTAVIVNVGRGPIIKEKELAEALKEGVIWGAGLDVYEKEPEVDAGLLRLRNTVLLPHIGSASFETRVRMIEMAVESVELALSGKTPKHLVNPEVLEQIG